MDLQLCAGWKWSLMSKQNSNPITTRFYFVLESDLTNWSLSRFLQLRENVAFRGRRPTAQSHSQTRRWSAALSPLIPASEALSFSGQPGESATMAAGHQKAFHSAVSLWLNFTHETDGQKWKEISQSFTPRDSFRSYASSFINFEVN